MASKREIVAQALAGPGAQILPAEWRQADRVLSALSDRSRSEVGGDVRAQCLSVFKAARDGGMQVPTVAGAWIPVCTAALDSLLAAWSPILAADAERRVREECAQIADAHAARCDAGNPSGHDEFQSGGEAAASVIAARIRKGAPHVG